MLFRIPSGRLPRCARNDKVLRTDNNKCMDYTVCAILSIKTKNYKRHFIRFHQLPHLINTTIYQLSLFNPSLYMIARVSF